MTIKMTANDLIKLLRLRHYDDVFVDECKTGSSIHGCMRLDGWALKKTWRPWTMIGYEIKVDRNDFTRDQKWENYLPYCHEFYFVCPPRLISVTDLPPGVGLLWATENGGKLYSKATATRHQPEEKKVCMLMSYLLMSRSRIVANMFEASADAPERRTEKWVELEIEKLKAFDARRKLSKLVANHVVDIVGRQESLIKNLSEEIFMLRYEKKQRIGIQNENKTIVDSVGKYFQL